MEEREGEGRKERREERTRREGGMEGEKRRE